MTSMPHLARIDWTHRDEMKRVDLGGGGEAFYVYDADGRRTRKVIERSAGLMEETIDVGGFEVFRRRLGGTLEDERTAGLLATFIRLSGEIEADQARLGSPEAFRQLSEIKRRGRGAPKAGPMGALAGPTAKKLVSRLEQQKAKPKGRRASPSRSGQ